MVKNINLQLERRNTKKEILNLYPYLKKDIDYIFSRFKTKPLFEFTGYHTNNNSTNSHLLVLHFKHPSLQVNIIFDIDIKNQEEYSIRMHHIGRGHQIELVTEKFTLKWFFQTFLKSKY